MDDGPGALPIAEDGADNWFCAGKFEEIAAAAAACARLSATPDSHYAYGRALVLTERIAEAAAWLRQAADLCPGGVRHRLLTQCLDADPETGARLADAEAAGLVAADWLAMAVLLAEKRLIRAALTIIDRHLDGGGSVPCRILRLLANWTDQSPQVGATMLRLAWTLPISLHLPIGHNRDEMVIVLRRLTGRGEFGVIADLAKAMLEQRHEEFAIALQQIMADWADQAAFRGVPLIGPSVVAMREARMRRRLSLLLGQDPSLACDEAPHFIELVPISEQAHREWETLTAQKG